MKNLIKVIFILFLLLTIGYRLSTANAAVPHLINYQGRLTNKSGVPINDRQTITFRIYDAENAGNLLWQGTYNNVSITKGVFSILLGEVNDEGYNFQTLAFDKPYWLEIKVGDEVMNKRQLITSAGYAIRAENVDSLPKGIIVMWSGSISDIPSDWALCDGTKGTPNLTDKFIVGAGNNYTVDATGGEAEHVLTEDEMPAHTHNYNSVAWRDIFDGGNMWSPYASGAEASTSTGGGQAHNNLPPYYALAYIMKS